MKTIHENKLPNLSKSIYFQGLRNKTTWKQSRKRSWICKTTEPEQPIQWPGRSTGKDRTNWRRTPPKPGHRTLEPNPRTGSRQSPEPHFRKSLKACEFEKKNDNPIGFCGFGSYWGSWKAKWRKREMNNKLFGKMYGRGKWVVWIVISSISRRLCPLSYGTVRAAKRKNVNNNIVEIICIYKILYRKGIDFFFIFYYCVEFYFVLLILVRIGQWHCEREIRGGNSFAGVEARRPQ